MIISVLESTGLTNVLGEWEKQRFNNNDDQIEYRTLHIGKM